MPAGMMGGEIPLLGDSMQTCDCGTPMVLDRSEIRTGINYDDNGVAFEYRQPWQVWKCPACARTLTGPPGNPQSSR